MYMDLGISYEVEVKHKSSPLSCLMQVRAVLWVSRLIAAADQPLGRQVL
jgi:hypothetical protein